MSGSVGDNRLLQDYLGQEDPLEKGVATTLVFLPEESHGQRSLAGYSPQGHEESDMMWALTIHIVN